jgi:hypothetical protein
MSYTSFIFEISDGIATIRLNDPERLNALTFQNLRRTRTGHGGMTPEVKSRDSVTVGK